MSLKTIDAETLKRWLDNKEAILLDVREPAEYAAENIPGSKLLPLAKVSKNALPELKGKKLVIHCKKGGRSSNACEKLLQEDPNIEIYNLEGGISSWAANGFAIKSSGKFFLPLDRQVQLAIGVFVMTGSLLGYLVSPLYFLIPIFFGLGLTFAGLTGFCGLAMIVSKMPWNS